MTEPDTAALVRQVQQGIGVEYGADQLVYAIAALAELSGRLEAVKRELSEQYAAVQHASDLQDAAEAEVERLRGALELTYASIDNLCARPGTCMAVRPRAALRDTASGK